MQTKISQQTNLTGISLCQEQITSELIDALRKLMVSKIFLTYRTKTPGNPIRHELNLEGQLNFQFDKPLDKNEVQNIRIAIDTWNHMELIYRLTVLDAYSVLFYEALSDYSSAERTILFCQIFINDFVGIITSN